MKEECAAMRDKNPKKINVGIGFATGRKNFKNVLKAYLDNWNESGVLETDKYSIHLFIAYDLTYQNTDISDYKITEEEILDMVDGVHYIGEKAIANEVKELIGNKIINTKEAQLIFGQGYAMKRNGVLHFVLKYKMDYLIFLDDDEYPVANVQMDDGIVWKGQEVLSTHIQNMEYADMTHGHHCGYISPIPQINFNEIFSENDFKQYIEAISNDIVNWDSVKRKLEDGGVTYAKLDIISNRKVIEVKEIGGMKFISGANLGFNLKNPDKLFPFYNPPGARGEDAFLSTCLGEYNIRKVPCYTFHDGYSTCQRLLFGVMPNQLDAMNVHSDAVYDRFLNASIGWIRYKPLLLFITNREEYKQKIAETKENLLAVIPKICDYFGNEDFNDIIEELEFYDTHVEEHFKDFEDTKSAWFKIVSNVNESNLSPDKAE